MLHLDSFKACWIVYCSQNEQSFCSWLQALGRRSVRGVSIGQNPMRFLIHLLEGEGGSGPSSVKDARGLLHHTTQVAPPDIEDGIDYWIVAHAVAVSQQEGTFLGASLLPPLLYRT